jgi:hypothetical protein
VCPLQVAGTRILSREDAECTSLQALH